ncbi:hypothetical protein WJX82_002806 [Trebouxia sp. C0006]
MSGPSERQIHKFRRDYAVKQQEQVLDIHLAVDRLHTLATPALRKATTKVEYEWRIVIQGVYPGQTDSKMSVVDLMKTLPVHLIACLLAQQPLGAGQGSWQAELTPHKLSHSSIWGYLAQGLTLLGNLCGVSAVIKEVSVAINQDSTFHERVLDLANLALSCLAGPEARHSNAAAVDPDRDQECLNRAAMVPAALNAVLYAFQPAAAVADVELHFLCMELFKQAASPIFLDAIFDAVAVVINMVRSALVSGNTSLDLYMLSYHAGVTMQVLAELTATPLFYYRLAIQEKPFAAPLRLIAAGLDLHSLPLAPPPFKQEGLTCVPILPGIDTHSTAATQGAAELLSARAMALMLCFSDYEATGFLDQAAGHLATSELLDQCVDNILGYAGLALQRPKVSAVPVEFTGEGQMQLNSLHMAEVLTDDSNFRQRAMDSLAAPMAHALSQSPQDFASAWLAGQEAFELHSKDTVNDATYLLLSSLSVEALRKANIIKALAMNLHLARPDKDPGSFRHTLALEAVERCITLFMTLGNLHWFTSATCPPQLENYFADLLVEQVKKQKQDQSLKQALQGVLANLQSLYQHNQLIFQAAHQHVPQDANLVLSQDELKLGERLILHLRTVHSSLPETTD